MPNPSAWNITSERRRLAELDDEAHALRTNPTEGRRNNARIREIEAKSEKIQAKLRAALANERGWVVTKTLFDLESLAAGRRLRSEIRTGGLINHQDCFIECRRPVALLTHSYTTDREQFVALARERNLKIEFLDWSWYFPERCLAALFIAPWSAGDVTTAASYRT